MKAKNTSYLIEMAKQAPTELAKQEVMGFITTIPTLPPPSSNWFQNFNLNSIIMTTTAITLVTSVVIYFSTLSTPDELVGPEIQVPPPIIEEMDSIDAEPNIQFERVQIDTIKEEAVEVKTTTTIALTPKEADTTVSEDKGLTVKKVTSISPAPISRANRNERPQTNRYFATDTKAIEPIVVQLKLTTSELRRLKRQLLSLLKQDNIKESGFADFSTLWYTQDHLQLNKIKLEGEMFTRYASVLKSFSIAPGPNRRVVVNNDFIQVGDFTEKGFDGQALGKKMEIYFIEGDEDNGLFSKAKALKKSLAIEDKDDDTILKTMGEFKHKEVNLSRVDRLLSSQGNASPKDGNRFYDSGKEALSIYTKRTEGVYVELNGKQLKSLKKDLYRELLRDQLIDSRKQDVRFLFESDDILVNGMKLTEQMTFSYQRLLETYGIKAAESRKILMCTDFIVIGDFKIDNFSGSLLGSLNSQDIRKSIFRQDFKDFPVFGFDKAMKEE